MSDGDLYPADLVFEAYSSEGFNSESRAASVSVTVRSLEMSPASDLTASTPLIDTEVVMNLFCHLTTVSWLLSVD